MATKTIINNIQSLSLAEQFFIIEQVLKNIHEKEQKREDFAKIGNNHMQNKEVSVISSAAPKGYMTVEDFRNRAKLHIRNYARKKLNSAANYDQNKDYISIDEFRKLVHEDTEKFCEKYGII